MKRIGIDRPLRAAAYCRVSTEKEDQINSLATQQQFFYEYIVQKRDWSLVGVFADEGLSGTSIRRRAQFAEMIRRAMDGEIDLIITKEVSRFARNTVDALQVTRQLKEKGVGVLFLNDNIDTRENDGEFRLTIMASVAQEESRKISERTRWGQLQAMRRGVVFGNNSLFGYTVANGRLTVDPEQAEVVRSIYRNYLEERKGAHTIARELTEAGKRPPLRSSGAWSPAAVLNILRTEKYCGDLLQKKYRTTDYLSHRKVINEGVEEQIFLKDHHEPIVSREQYEAVQAELKKRAGAAEDRRRFSARYWFSGKICCAVCGRSFTVKRTRRADGKEYQRFVCRGHLDREVDCPMPAVSGRVIQACARRTLQEIGLDGPAIVAGIWQELAQLEEEDDTRRLRQAVLRQEGRKNRALEGFLDGALTGDEMRQLVARCEEELKRLQKQLEEAVERRRPAEQWERIYTRLERELAGGEAVLDEVIQRITVYPDCFLVEVAELPVRFRMYTARCGRVEITRCGIEPIPSHEKKDWRLEENCDKINNKDYE